MANKLQQEMAATCAHVKDQEVLLVHQIHVDAHAMVSPFLLGNKSLLEMVATPVLVKHQEV